MPRLVPVSGFMHYPQTTTGSAQQATTSASTSLPTANSPNMLQEYGGFAKNLLAPSSTSIAEGYNQIYDFATGFKGAPGTNLATGTSSSGTFGGGNLANAAYGYAGGKLANELFDNKGYSDIGGTVGAALGASAAVGGSAAGVAMGAQFGSFAGPIGALAGAVLGAAVGSLFGSKGISDSHFRSYSGELGKEVSDFNKKQAQRYGIAQRGGYVQREAGGKYQNLTTFAHSQSIDNYTFQNPIASTKTPFGKYAITFVDDMKNEDALSFSNSWVKRVKGVDEAFAKLLTPKQIQQAKKGLSGSVQASMEWEKKSQANIATADVLIDRYARIAQLAGRKDIYKAIITGAAAPKGRDQGGITLLGSIISQYTPRPVVERPVVERPVVERPVVERPVEGDDQQADNSQTSDESSRQRRRITISRPEGVVNEAMELKYVG